MTLDQDNAQAAGRKPVHVLVAEDSPLNLQVALKQLEKLGFAADAVTDGSQVLEAIGRTHYDIVLMDCQMPEMNGYEATLLIRLREQAQSESSGTAATHLHIIAMTANTEADNREKCRAAGMDDYINKPVQLPELEAALHRALADRGTQQAMEEVIDPVIIAGLRQLRTPGKSDPLAELIDLFVQEAPTQLDAIEKAVAQNDMWSIARTVSAATQLKGSAVNLGARRLGAICDEIEQAAKEGNLSDIVPMLERARQEFGRVRTTLVRIRDEAPSGGNLP
jgi:CheY-like chemotaxis protein/HPt (histidine-containing phosphotransfer) domain-containing protein